MLKNNNNEKIIEFYEKNIDEISKDYLLFLKKIKNNWELVSLPFISETKDNTYRVLQTMKLQIQSMFKENEKINKNLNEVKKTERMNHVYKNVINKFGEQIDYNRR